MYILTKYGKKWAILDIKTRVYYFGNKRELEKRLKQLNEGFKCAQ